MYIKHIYDRNVEKPLHLFLVNNPGMAMPFAMLLQDPDLKDRTVLCNAFCNCSISIFLLYFR